MNHKDILDAYRSGELTITEVEEQLQGIKRQSSKGPLSEGQKGLWMLQKMSPDMGAYNIPLCFRISKKLDIEKFKKALLFVQKQYPVLTSVIKEENGIPFQTAESSTTLHFEEADMSDMNSSDILPFIREKAKEPFELDKGPLMRTHLFHLSKDECMALITIHHVIFDGVSMLTFISTLLDAYSEFIQGREPALQVLSASYHDFVDWEKNMLDTREGAEHLAYWKEQLSGTLPVLELPADHPRSSAQKGKGQAYKSLLPHELGKQIKSFARSHHVNESVVFLAFYKVLLHHYTNQKDIIVGMPTMGRPEDSFESIIGYFINMIAVRSKEIGTQTFTDFIRDLQLTVADGLDHAAYPFPALVRELHVDRAAAESPVFQAAFLYQNFFQTAGVNNMLEQYQTLGIEFVEELRQEGEFELALEVYEQGDETALHLLYNPDLFELSSIERMMGHYIKLAEEIIHDPSASLETYSNLLHLEQTNLLNQWNATETDDSKDKCIHEIFEEKAKKTPDAIAVIFEEETLTYQELDEKSTSVAVYLQEQGAGPESAVGICTERSLDMLVGILGILKAGGAYVPFDPNFPKERLEFMLKDSEVSIVLTQSKVYDKIEQVNVKNINIITIDSACENTSLTQQNRILKREVKPHHLAYILYTSGSTGKPKGVMVEHRSIMNTLNFLEAHYPVTAEDAYLLKTNYVFDVSISELFGWFIGNGRLIILPPGGEKSPQLCMDYIEKYQVTHINFAPAMLSVFLEMAADHKGFTENGPIKYMMIAGEAFPKELVKKAVAIFKNSSIENIYGPTEASIYAAYFGCTKEEISSHHTPIGKPVSNTRIYIVDQHLQPVLIGKPGELCIAGDGLARGYYNQPELTAKTFIDNPFEPGTKLYKTGDSARWLSDGNIEYLGRIDSQVKIRGFRIELGAIESKLSEYPGILDQAVVVNQLEGHKRLAAYYTEQKSAVDPKELRRHLKSSLPEYMIPSHFIRLDEMPLTPSGKVNRKDLEYRKIVLERKKTNLLPLSEVEDKVHRIWEDILKVSGFGAEDGFFDVGGDSLLAVTAAERIKKELDCEFSVTELFEYSNIRAISQYIIESKKTDAVHSSFDKQQEMKRDEKQPEQQTLPPYAEDSVAIVGISCQFPGAKNHHDFWTNLKEGKESIQFFSKEELRTCGVPEELIQHPDYVPTQSAIEGKDLFDPGFFQMSPKDAEFMDPQLRLLLQHSWKAIEDAGYVSKEIPGTSVYMSASNNSYRSLLPAESTEGHESPDGYVSWVLAQSGTIPTMISHKLGLKGPSYFVHANCSSSLVGLYQAYKSITSGEAKYALVGGATLHAQSGIGYVHQTGLNFSSDGHVKAFDASADGMAGGEGVAVVLLKKAADAVKDGDHIYALMRGIGLNNDGADKVGFYAPSVKGQTEVIQNVLDAANIHPETVSYIEAHGTGTKLGDPIEFSALNQVYKQYTDKKQFCGIGSVKTNIGHLDTAAGLAGCIKVAMSLYHNELAPSINYREPNPNINLDDSPFYVVKEGKSLEKKETVHRAALSSFGLGGTNAHAIFEQYASFSDVREESKGNPPYLIPVSAKNKERLQAYARELLAFINRKDQVHICLADVAYTFQIGREAMDSRVVFMASDVEEWKQQLENFIDGKLPTKGCFQGEKSRIKDAAPWLEDDETQELISSWLSKGKQKKLAEMWAKGLHVEWRRLYPHAKPQRMSLPTYPFAEERYWPEISAADDKRSAGPSLLHPLVHHNTSVLSEQRFSSIFTGQEYFIAEHIIKGMAIVPAAVTLEMARAAVEQGLDDVKEQRTIRLKNVVWVRPVVAGHQPIKVNIGLYDEDDGQILYRMYGEPEDADTDPVLYSQGIAELCQTDHVTALDLAAIKNQCNQGSMDTALFYAGMIGADYGPGYKAVETVYMGDGQLLAKLSLPDSVSHTQDQYVLHPSVIDGALQAAEYLQNITRAGLSGSEEDFKAALPFALEELEVIHHCVPDMWVYVQFNEKNKPGDLIQKVDIHLCDEHGTVCVRIKGFSTRVMDGDAQSEAGSETLMLEPVWKEQNAAPGAQAHEYAEHLVFFCEYDQEIRDRVEAEMGHVRVFNLDGRPGSLEERFHSYTEQVFKKVQAIFQSKPQGSILVQIVTSSEGEQQLFSGMTGLLKTAELEHARLTGQIIEISDKEGWESISDKLKENQTNRGAHIRYKNGKRYIADWNELEPANHEAGHPWKDDGVYLITGGAGGLGLIFAREIAEKTQHASFILTGRSPLGENKKRKLEEIRNMGANISYKQTDVTDKIGVYQLINDIQQEYGRLNGILHSAGIIKDNYMIKKSAEELHAVLSPKVKGLVYLDEASKDMALDVFILFSSLSGSIGSIGQSDYAAANVFMDAYAGYRRTLADLGRRHGKTIAVNWPLWKEGGMKVDRETEERLVQTAGVVPLEAEKGIGALYQALNSEMNRVMVIQGDLQKIKQKLLQKQAPASAEQKVTETVAEPIRRIDTGSLLDKVKAVLKQEVAKLLKVKIVDIDDYAEMTKYGFDSISMTEFTNHLNRNFKLELTPTIFFDHPTIHEFGKHLAQEYEAVFAEKFTARAKTQSRIPAADKKEEHIQVTAKKRRTRQVILPETMQGVSAPEPIAIVGISGIFPMAKDVDAYWHNLKEGKDCMTEIPKDRWDWREYQGDPAKEANKTNVKWGGFIDGIGEFDPLFFGISPREAEQMEPQQRLLLTYAWKAIEDAGYSTKSLSGTKTGVFIGTGNTGYGSLLSKANSAIDGSAAANTSPSVGPNRVSYFLNLHGPSEPIDTACSSSLVAIHHAISSIEEGTCDMALAGGVNTIILPEVYISFDKAGALSKEGRCKTFSDQADGFAHGEGAGILFLKKLKAAEKAGDHIYGVIKGSAVNHGGRAASLTTPNPKAQAEVIQAAYKKAGIDPKTVTYIEAHGTGTELGDPVEINGLKAAFKALDINKGDSAVNSNYCGLGSAKTNIGHLSLAAGAAGIIKILLQLKHKTLVKSLHCESINPYIQLKDSPFYIVQETREWKTIQNEQGQEQPRRAGVSSFGIGGVNAHVVIEEYVPNSARSSVETPYITSQNPGIFVLSAKNEVRLKEHARQLADAIGKSYKDEDLINIAYTLQAGRDAMEERLGIIAGSVQELQEKLKEFAEGQSNVEDLYRGKIDKGTLQTLTTDEEIQEAIEKWMERGKFAKLLELWVKGLDVDWTKLYADNQPKRISLPTYPFAKDRYWISDNSEKNRTLDSNKRASHSVTSAVLHPLMHQNTSNLMEQRFSSIYTGEEFFLADHVVKGQRILPGVAHLEMARAAIEQAAELQEGQNSIKLKNAVWVRPIVVEDQPLKVHIGLSPEDHGEIAYEIYSNPEAPDEKPVVYSQGSAVLNPDADVPVIDLRSLQAQCNQSQFTVSEVYDTYRMIGFDYGPAFRGVERVYTGKNLVLARLSLHPAVLDTVNQYAMHPGLMDSALQASSILTGAGDNRLMLPFAVQELEVFGACSSVMWTYARYSKDSKATDKVQKRDIDICDENGNVCVRMKGLSFRAAEGESDAAGNTQTMETLMLEPCWIHQDAGKDGDPEYERHIVMVCEMNGISKESIETRIKGAECIVLESVHEGLAERFQDYAEQAFEIIQSILKSKPKGHVLIQTLAAAQSKQQLFSGLTGLLKTAGLENSKLKGQMIEIEPNEEIESIAEKVKENKRNAEDRHIKYEKGKRYIADLSEVNETDREITMPWKDNGVYLITGGAGGLGFIFAKEIVSQVNQPVLILTGRSGLSADKHSQLKELQRLGARAEYRQIDVTQKLAVADLITSITADYGDLNGIIHSAGLIKDNYLITKNKEELQQVLAPKVKGLVNVDEASEHLALDFFILFSSISGVVGSAGQADYAMANAFMDSYAAYRNALVKSMYRHGKTLSINWPLWKEGGMHVDEETERMTLKNTGVTAMRTETGIQALYKGLAYGTNNVIVMEGIRDIMKDKLFQKTPSAAAPKETVQEPVNPAAAIEDGALSNQIEEVLKQEISQLLKIKPEEIDADVEFNQYGFDSITLTEFANKLNDEYKLNLTPTIFFEYATVNTFAAYLSEEYLDKFTAQFAADVKVEKPVQSVEKNIEGNRFSHKQRFAKQTVPPVQTVADQAPEPIAIVGMSGVFPKAEDVEEYWANLKEGVDCITEVPKDRWDWREFYGDPLKEANKTNVKWGGFIDGVADFDPLFFGISPLEAEQMEPQQRLLLTYAWKAIEEAGYSAQSLSGSKTGIFIGTGNTGYSSLLSNVEIEGSSAANMSPSAGPNRVSYLLNIHGPSEPIDTACSSSLVAIHHAVCAIEAGNCEMAIAGGVNTVVTPQGHIAYDKAGALSKEGRCKTFSDKADGFAVSEGAGILFLKKLKAAEQAGDHIYGVIKGSAVNHGGRANSLTTPNPKAQAEVVKTAYTKAGIDPRTVTYIEAHGTGTELGDPVEINGLKAAFKALYEKTGDPSVQTSHCGLGSAKTNIGHLSLAAGVAGVIKILLQLKHKTLVKSLYSESVNPYIKLEDSPFYIVQESREWKALKDAAGRELPRRAGVSSFGIGGVNAHVVIEEYIPKETSPAAEAPAVSSQNPGIFVLSAKEEERLKEQAQQLSEAISKQSFTNSDLIDVAYTLQAGRDEMEERLGIIAVSVQDLQEKLKKFITGQTNAEGLYRGRVDKRALQTLMADEETQKAMKNGWEHRTYAKLLELWVKGMKMDWNSLYGEDQPKRLSLPTYPFAKERYWVTDMKEKDQTHQISVKSAGAAVIHPLLQENISDLSEQRFSSVFTGQEYFFKDHMVQGSPVMPGVAYLEMVHAAVTQAVRGLKDKQSVIQIKNVVWVQPIVSDGQPVQVDISLDPHQDGEIAFEIYTDGEKNERHIHSQGSAVICGAQEKPKLDIGTLQAQCNQNTISAEQCYELFKAIGIDYGPGLQGIKNLYIGRNQALAELSLPSSVSGTTDQFVLHPSMADSALQASIGLKLNSGDDQLSLPFALQELEVFSKCTGRMWASVTSRTNEERIQRLDIDLCDEQGQVCVRIKGISSRVLEEDGQSPRDRKTPEVTESLNGALLMAPLWDQVHVEKSRVVPSASERVVIIGGDEKSSKAVQSQYPHVQSLTIDQHDRIDEIEYKLKACGAFDHIVWIASARSAGKKADNEMIEAQNQGVIKMYKVIKAMLALGCGDRDIKWTVVTENTQFVDQHDIVNPVHAGIHGLIGSMAKEYTNWQTTLIDLGATDDWSPEIWSLPGDRDGNTWACRNKIWYKQRLVPVHKTQSVQSKYKHGGVYVVIGGAGGIGEAWSEYVIKTYQAHVVWIGRRKKDEAIQAKLDKLADLGPAPFYIEADAANQVELENAYEKIKLMHQEINGIVHSAIVLQDQSLANMTEERFRNVLSAKVDVSVRMAQVFHNEPLDFALFFSSVQSFARASGQSNYAAGCSFKDAFAHWLSQVWPCAVAVMNWSYWGSVGVVSSPDYQQRMAQAGIGSIEAPEAMEALELLLGGPLHQLVLMKMAKEAASEAEQLKETIEVYPEEHSSTIQKLRSYHPGDSTKIQQLI